MMYFEAEHHISVIPYVMQTQAGKYSGRAKKYNDQQVELQHDLANLAIVYGAKYKNNGIKYPIDTPCTVDFIATYRTNVWRDTTNVRKAVEDALQGAGILKDDNAHIVVGTEQSLVFLGQPEDLLFIKVQKWSMSAENCIKLFKHDWR